MLDDIFVLDGVAHAFDMSESNIADPEYATPVNHLQSHIFSAQPPGYDLEPEATLKDWPVDDTANILFRETQTDAAIFHPVPIYFFKDGLCGFHKALEATKRWPNRFIGSYCTVDPLRPDPVEEFERQFEQLANPVGLKLYPTGYADGVVTPWNMDDPEIGFPLYEKARELGINSIAVHKSLPLGPAPDGPAFNPSDIEGAAWEFPDVNFSIVHGGFSFTEETAWLLGRFENIWINMETLNVVLMLRPTVFGEIMAGLMSVGGEAVIDRMYWGSGAMNCHPRAGLEAFLDYELSDDVRSRYGALFEIPQLTHEHKRKILGENLARLHGIDLDAVAKGMEGDEFSSDPGRELPDPYSTTTVADAVMTPYPGSTAVTA